MCNASSIETKRKNNKGIRFRFFFYCKKGEMQLYNHKHKKKVLKVAILLTFNQV